MSLADRQAAAFHAGAIAPVTLMGLHVELKKRLDVVAARFPLLATENPSVTRAPQILDGFTPPRQKDDPPLYPFFIVRPDSGEDTWEGADQSANATVKIIVGTFSDDNAGFLDVLLLIDAIRADLLQNPTIEGTTFEHNGPLTWKLPEDQPRPMWLGVVTTIWNVSRPRRVDSLYPEQED